MKTEQEISQINAEIQDLQSIISDLKTQLAEHYGEKLDTELDRLIESGEIALDDITNPELMQRHSKPEPEIHKLKNLKIRFEGVGCATANVITNKENIELRVSYLCDMPYGFLRTLHDLIRGMEQHPNKTLNVWYGEPGAYLWKFDLKPCGKLHIHLSLDKKSSLEYPKNPERVIFMKIKFRKFLKIVIRQFENEIHRAGIVGYSTNWDNTEFPFAAYLSIKQFIAKKTDVLNYSDTPGDYFVKSNLKSEFKILKKLLKQKTV